MKKKADARAEYKAFVVRQTRRKVVEAGGNPRSVAFRRAEKAFRRSS